MQSYGFSGIKPRSYILNTFLHFINNYSVSTGCYLHKKNDYPKKLLKYMRNNSNEIEYMKLKLKNLKPYFS